MRDGGLDDGVKLETRQIKLEANKQGEIKHEGVGKIIRTRTMLISSRYHLPCDITPDPQTPHWQQQEEAVMARFVRLKRCP